MFGVLIGYTTIVVVIAAGYLVARTGLLGNASLPALNRLIFFVLSPCLLFTSLAAADVRLLFSQQLPVLAIASIAVIATYVLLARFAWRRPIPETTIGAFAAGYTNAGNIGIPLSIYVLGDAAAPVPVFLLQLVLLAPIGLAVLDLSTQAQRPSPRRILLQPVRNPLLLGALAGLVVALSGWHPPEAALAPLQLVGAAAVPMMLLVFGMSLRGSRPFVVAGFRRDVALVTGLKLIVMPLIAWGCASFLFGLTGHSVFVVTALAALPSAQNVYNFAARYRRGEPIARDSVLLTTALSFPALIVVAALLAA